MNTPIRLLVVTEKSEQPAPLDVDALMACDVDTDRVAAIAAATVLRLAVSRCLDWRDDLERAVEALGVSSVEAERAGHARQHLDAALELTNPLIAELSDAEDALDFGWKPSAISARAL